MSAGVTVQMIHVFALPPKEGWRILVSLESLKGMWALQRGEGREREREKGYREKGRE